MTSENLNVPASDRVEALPRSSDQALVLGLAAPQLVGLRAPIRVSTASLPPPGAGPFLDRAEKFAQSWLATIRHWPVAKSRASDTRAKSTSQRRQRHGLAERRCLPPGEASGWGDGARNSGGLVGAELTAAQAPASYRAGASPAFVDASADCSHAARDTIASSQPPPDSYAQLRHFLGVG